MRFDAVSSKAVPASETYERVCTAARGASLEGKIATFPGSLIVADPELKILYMSDGAQKVFGASASGSLLALLSPSEVYETSPTDPLALFVKDLRVSSGTWHYIELKRRGTRFAGEKSLYIWGRRDVSEASPCLIFYFEDRSAENQLAEYLIRAQKGEALGILCASLAHDLNNVLTILTVQLEQMKERASGEESGTSAIDRMLAETGHSAVLVQQILNFGRNQPKSVFRHLDLREPLKNAADMISSMLQPDVSLELRLPECELPVAADPIMVEQAVINLCLNARDAMTAGGRITLQGAMSETTLPNRRRCAEIVVKDTGTGIAPETLPRIFEPFFSTKTEKGTGLGLSSARWIAEFHGGSISAESILGKGSAFRILIPADSL